MKKIFGVLIIALANILLMGCGEDEVMPRPMLDDSLPSVTVIFSVGGPGDNGYNDLMMKGVVHYCDSANVSLHTLCPNSLGEASAMIEDWLKATANKQQRSLLVLTGNEYAGILEDVEDIEDDKRTILFLESPETDLPKGIVSASIEREGVMYLAGAMSARTSAYIMGGMEDDEMVEASVKAFKDGYKAHNESGEEVEVFYLSDDESGYSQPNLAFNFMKRINKEREEMAQNSGTLFASRFIVLPLAGASNLGAYFYMMQQGVNPEVFSAVIGMDKDFSGTVETVPFSVVLYVDWMLKDCLTTWLKGDELPKHRTYTMAEGYASIVVNNGFYYNSYYAIEGDEIEIDEDGEPIHNITFLPENYFQKKYVELLAEAMDYAKKTKQ